MNLFKLSSVVVADAHSCGEPKVHCLLQAISQGCLLEKGEREMYLHVQSMWLMLKVIDEAACSFVCSPLHEAHGLTGKCNSEHACKSTTLKYMKLNC